MVFNNQFAPEKHISQALDAIEALAPAKKESVFASIKLPF